MTDQEFLTAARAEELQNLSQRGEVPPAAISTKDADFLARAARTEKLAAWFENSDEELAKIGEFRPLDFYLENKDVLTPQQVERLARVYELRRRDPSTWLPQFFEGLRQVPSTVAGIISSTVTAGSTLLPGKDTVEGAGAAVEAVKEGARWLLSGGKDEEAKRKATDALAKIGAMQQERLGALTGGVETMAAGYGDLARKAVRFDVQHRTLPFGVRLKADILEPGTFFDKETALDRFMRDASVRETLTQVGGGQGAVAMALGLDAKSLEQLGVQVDPKALAGWAFLSDPINWAGFAAGLKAAQTARGWAVVDSAGRTVATAPSEASALNFITAVNDRAATIGAKVGRAARKAVEAPSRKVSEAAGSLSEALLRKPRPSEIPALGETHTAAYGYAGGGSGTPGFLRRLGAGVALRGVQNLADLAAHPALMDLLEGAASGAAAGTVIGLPFALAGDDVAEATTTVGSIAAVGGAGGAVPPTLNRLYLGAIRARQLADSVIWQEGRQTPARPIRLNRPGMEAWEAEHERVAAQLPAEDANILHRLRAGWAAYEPMPIESYVVSPEFAARVDPALKGKLGAAPVTVKDANGNTHHVLMWIVDSSGRAPSLTHEPGHLFVRYVMTPEERAAVLEVIPKEAREGFHRRYLERDLTPEQRQDLTQHPEKLDEELLAELFSRHLDGQLLDLPGGLLRRMLISVSSGLERLGLTDYELSPGVGQRGTRGFGIRPSYQAVTVFDKVLERWKNDPWVSQALKDADLAVPPRLAVTEAPPAGATASTSAAPVSTGAVSGATASTSAAPVSTSAPAPTAQPSGSTGAAPVSTSAPAPTAQPSGSTGAAPVSTGAVSGATPSPIRQVPDSLMQVLAGMKKVAGPRVVTHLEELARRKYVNGETLSTRDADLLRGVEEAAGLLVPDSLMQVLAGMKKVVGSRVVAQLEELARRKYVNKETLSTRDADLLRGVEEAAGLQGGAVAPPAPEAPPATKASPEAGARPAAEARVAAAEETPATTPEFRMETGAEEAPSGSRTVQESLPFEGEPPVPAPPRVSSEAPRAAETSAPEVPAPEAPPVARPAEPSPPNLRQKTPEDYGPFSRSAAQQRAQDALARVEADPTLAPEQKQAVRTLLTNLRVPHDVHYEAAVTSATGRAPGRVQRRAEIEAARNNPALRELASKLASIPLDARVLRNGEVQVQFWSGDKLLANLDEVLRELTAARLEALIPYETHNGRLTERGARTLADDILRYTANQNHGYRGDGMPLTRPAGHPGFIPPVDPSYVPKPLSSPKALDFINLLMGEAPPQTTRTYPGIVPLQVRAKRLAEANRKPGEVVPPVRRYKPPFEDVAITDYNPLRTQLRKRGVELRNLTEVHEWVNAKYVRKAIPRPDIALEPTSTDVTAAGFMPVTRESERIQPNPAIRELASEYTRLRGLRIVPHTGNRPVNEALAMRIADWFESAKHEPDSPQVRAAYDAFKRETLDQWNFAVERGYTFEPWLKEGQPYRNSAEMAKDVRDNKHLYFFLTEQGSGPEARAVQAHPLLENAPVTIAGKTLTYNDLFRAVRDLFGHAAEGYEFGPRGEYNAFLKHVQMYSDAARPAMAAETLGQNSWVNFGPHLRVNGKVPKKGEPGYRPLAERPYAEQKATLVPPDLLREAIGAVEARPRTEVTVRDAAGREYRVRFDGWQDFGPFGREAQFTALEDIPGVVPRGSTTYARSLQSRGYEPPLLAEPGAPAFMPDKVEGRNIAAPSLEDFKNEQTLPIALAKPGWAIITATQEAIGPFNHPENLRANEALAVQLRTEGFSYAPVRDYYKGVDQGESFLVTGITPEHALELGKQYKQESVLVPQGLLYADGTLNPIIPGQLLVGEAAKKADFFMEIPGGPAFSLALDFETRLSPAQWQRTAGWRESGLAFKDFFSEVTRGEFGHSKVPFEPTISIAPAIPFLKELARHTGLFDDHIAKSIPTYKETQVLKGWALVKSLPDGARILDIGASEGSWLKTLVALREGRVTGVALDPNPDMARFFREKSSVPGAEYVEQAFLQGFMDNDRFIPAYKPDEKFDVVHETMAFQLISPDRPAQIAEVKRLLKPDGMFLTEEKLFNSRWEENERVKDTQHKLKYYTEEELKRKNKKVGFTQSEHEEKAVGMTDNMVSAAQLETELAKHFAHVVQYWDAGNFRGYVASDSLPRIQAFLRELGDTRSQFSNERTPRAITTATVFLPDERNPEAVRAAAVRLPDGRVFEGPIHALAWAEALRELSGREPERWERWGIPDDVEEGFVTNKGEFLSRKQAEVRARRLGQFTPHDDRPLPGAQAAEDYGLEAYEFQRAQRQRERQEFQAKTGREPLWVGAIWESGETSFRVIDPRRLESFESAFQPWLDDSSAALVAFEWLDNTVTVLRRADLSDSVLHDGLFGHGLGGVRIVDGDPAQWASRYNAASVAFMPAETALSERQRQRLLALAQERGLPKQYEKDWLEIARLHRELGKSFKEVETYLKTSTPFDMRNDDPRFVAYRIGDMLQTARNAVETQRNKNKSNPRAERLAKSEDIRKLTPTAWFTPEGNYLPFVEGGTHNAWLLDNAAALKERYGLDVHKVRSDENIRLPAVNAGFVRIRWVPERGELHVDISAKHWAKHRRRLQEFVETHVEKLDHLIVEVLNRRGGLEDLIEMPLFRADDPLGMVREAFDNIRVSGQAPVEAARGPSKIAVARSFPVGGVALMPAPKNAPRDIEVRPARSEKKTGQPRAPREEPRPQTLPYLPEQKSLPRLERKIFALFDKDFWAVLPVKSRESAEALQQHAANSGWETTLLRRGTRGWAVLLRGVDRYEALQLAQKWGAATFYTPWGETYASGHYRPAIFRAGADGEFQLADGGTLKFGWQATAGKKQEVPPRQLTLTGEPEQPKRSVRQMTVKELETRFPEATLPQSMDAKIEYGLRKAPLLASLDDEQAVARAAELVLEDLRPKLQSDDFQLGSTWYSRITAKLKEWMDGVWEMFAELLAATSPRNRVSINWQFAETAMREYLTGAYDAQIAKLQEGLRLAEQDKLLAWYEKTVPKTEQVPNPDLREMLAAWISVHDLAPKQPGGQNYGMHGAAILKVFARQWLTGPAAVQGLKVRQFALNLLGRDYNATIDVWAARWLRRVLYQNDKRWRILPQNETGVSEQDFVFAQQVLARVAKELNLRPSDVQGGAWFVEKRLWEEKGWQEADFGDYAVQLDEMIARRQQETQAAARPAALFAELEEPPPPPPPPRFAIRPVSVKTAELFGLQVRPRGRKLAEVK